MTVPLRCTWKEMIHHPGGGIPVVLELHHLLQALAAGVEAQGHLAEEATEMRLGAELLVVQNHPRVPGMKEHLVVEVGALSLHDDQLTTAAERDAEPHHPGGPAAGGEKVTVEMDPV